MRARRQGTQKSKAASGGKGCADREDEVLPLHAGKQEHHGRDARDDERSAEVGLLDDEQNENNRHDGCANQGVLPIAHGIETGVEKPGEKKNDDGLGNFRG